MQAADSRNKDVVELLLKYGADTNSINHKGNFIILKNTA